MSSHPTGHGLPPTTHTVEMAQVADLNQRLANSRSPVIIASELGLGGVDLLGGATGTLAPQSVLTRVSWQGSPEFPEVHGHFGSADQSSAVDLHTAALVQISRRLLLRHRWGA